MVATKRRKRSYNNVFQFNICMKFYNLFNKQTCIIEAVAKIYFRLDTQITLNFKIYKYAIVYYKRVLIIYFTSIDPRSRLYKISHHRDVQVQK